MLISKPFVKLPLLFDHTKLAKEISQFDESEWLPHPQGFAGNSSLILTSTMGEENHDLAGPIKAATRLDKTPHIKQLMASFGTVIGRSHLMRLAPGASVSPHTDSHYYWRSHLRIHIPIKTHSSVTFYCGKEKIHMAAGESWTLSNWQGHSVENRSNDDSIHLIIDTVGSSQLWQMIDGRDTESRQVNFVENDEPELVFEGFGGLPILPHSELQADIESLINDISELTASDTSHKNHLRQLTTDFIHDWHAQWASHGPSIEGFPGFKNLLEAFKRKIDNTPTSLTLASNSEPFKEAALFTLDAALMPEKFSVPATNILGSSHSIKRPHFDRPVFIVAAPRSGSTLLFETMAVNRELWSLGDEAHKHFESIAALRPSANNASNRLTAEMLTPDIKEALLNSFSADLMNSDGQKYSSLSDLSRPSEIRFLEKTPKNALRIPFIVKAFPDARFIFLYRDAKQNISSLLETWRSQSWVTYPSLPGWPKKQAWSHLLIPGWQELMNRPLAEITAQQWIVTNQTILNDLQKLPEECWCAIDYDAFLADTPKEVSRLCSFAQIICGPRMHDVATKPLKFSKYTLSAPQKDKWKKNAAEIEPILKLTEPLMAKLHSLTDRQ